MSPADRKTATYRLFDADGGLIYVGAAYVPSVRIRYHRSHKPWGQEIARHEVAWHPSRAAAEAVEEVLIKRFWPRYNVLHTPVHRLRSVMHCSDEARSRAAERARADYDERGYPAEPEGP